MAKRDSGAGKSWRAMPVWLIPLATLAVGAVTYFAVSLLLEEVRPPSDADPLEAAKLRVETIRTGLTVGAGAAGAVLLLLTARRQWLAEQTQLATEHDATERRITELYVKAAEQLGSDKAAVRLASLYALERLAQDNSGHRQTVIDLMCAYLRMPFTSPQLVRVSPEPTDDESAKHAAAREELEVRSTVQRILHRHLFKEFASRRHQSAFWGGMDVAISLVGARLVDFTFTRACIGYADFSGATFEGSSSFEDCNFTFGAIFDGATFGPVTFASATFGNRAGFSQAVFEGIADFAKTAATSISFDRAKFGGTATFDESTFGTLSDVCDFSGTTFSHYASFRNVFYHLPTFVETQFEADVTFNSSNFVRNANFEGCHFSGHATFLNTRLGGGNLFITSTFHKDADLAGAILAPGTSGDEHLPPGWKRGPKHEDTRDLYTVIAIPQPRRAEDETAAEQICSTSDADEPR
ncbi:pentapeptide repeat-containing protein [Micromonospora sp. NPDC049175]|uniref:pentapeptide repeat-containing protein n=1 Tax=Micromonospora sp. NPDC049175 TaxID=3364266 RepID=UPI003719DDD6